MEVLIQPGTFLGLKSTAFVTDNTNGGLKHRDRTGSCTIACLRQNDRTLWQFGSELQPSHRHLHPCRSSPRQASSLGSWSIASVDPAVGHGTHNKSTIEEQQKLLLKKKGESLQHDLRGTSLFLVGMMGSGKTTVGKHIADALRYLSVDSDKLVEDAAGGITVAQMFREGNEQMFRDAESETLMQLSSHLRLVVATGGGAVVRPQNWGYMRHGITIWLDVPLEALARRVVAVGCGSRPLIGEVTPESAYHQALTCLENLYEEREGYYKNADAVVSVSGLATMMGLDINVVTPTMLAIQVLEEIRILIAEKKKATRVGLGFK